MWNKMFGMKKECVEVGLGESKYVTPVVSELGSIESVVLVTGAGTNVDGEVFNS
jgi:hypothetical protein